MNPLPPHDARPAAMQPVLSPLGAGIPPAAGATPPPPIVNAPPSGLALLKALRRRWQLAIIVAPIAAAVVIAAVWLLMPAGKHTAKASLFISPTAPNPILRTPASDAQSLDNFRQLQIALIKNQKV